MGSVYSLFSAGLTIIFGIMRIINFAHGELYMLGGFIAFFLLDLFQVNFVLSIILSVIITFLIAIIIQRFTIHHLTERTTYVSDALILTFGIGVFAQNLALWLWGADFRRIPNIFEGGIEILGASQSYQRIFTLLIVVVVFLVLHLFLKFHKLGRALRAVSENREAASLMGINPSRIDMLGFGLGSALAAIAGILVSPLYYVYPRMGALALQKSFPVVYLGGLGSVKGALIGGFILGIAENLASAYFLSAYRNAVGFIVLIGILITKPTGLYGKRR